MSNLRKARAEHGGNDSLRLAAEMALDYIRREDWTNPQGKEVWLALRQALAKAEWSALVDDKPRIAKKATTPEVIPEATPEVTREVTGEVTGKALAQLEQGNSSLNYHNTEPNTSLDKIVELAIQGHASTRDAIWWAVRQALALTNQNRESSYAGVKMWVGDKKIEYWVSKTCIEHEAVDGMSMKLAVNSCLQALKESKHG